MEYYLYYIFIGLHINVILSLMAYYGGRGEGYVVIPQPTIFLLTIFTWPLTLWEVIEGFFEKDEDNE